MRTLAAALSGEEDRYSAECPVVAAAGRGLTVAGSSCRNSPDRIRARRRILRPRAEKCRNRWRIAFRRSGPAALSVMSTLLDPFA
ncbi:hypothetical protein FGU65_03850 [Methanoculleus sp. FWC-SCC1]|uniref:Uncharacterized protein n=1 Tax=Methanoculleus frigidifontis TaxID=2584085 RepID=A0ABT8M7X4_9EURY|nr:hypothetical protein [Methanoculleus sp. FWC-SCC1]MDN7024032.1 hypothetical protein [Methanoculleus sp. FWC-SCC1]